MSTADMRTPDLVPVLSRGKHRNPRKGACFMEFASYLAGERWSDHPSCTHPLLAALARLVNDYTSDAERGRLTRLVPSVVGLASADVRVDLRIALRAAMCALPVVAEERQRSMATAVIVADRLLGQLDGRPAGHLEEASRHALAQAPLAAGWARTTMADMPVSLRGFRRRGAPAAVLYAVDGLAKSCTPDPDALLRELLTRVIADVTDLVRPSAGAPARSSVDAGRPAGQPM